MSILFRTHNTGPQGLCSFKQGAERGVLSFLMSAINMAKSSLWSMNSGMNRMSVVRYWFYAR